MQYAIETSSSHNYKVLQGRVETYVSWCG